MQKMNHDYSHCSDYKHGICPLECFRGMLVRDLDSRTYASWISFKGTDECLLTNKDKDKVKVKLEKIEQIVNDVQIDKTITKALAFNKVKEVLEKE